VLKRVLLRQCVAHWRVLCSGEAAGGGRGHECRVRWQDGMCQEGMCFEGSGKAHGRQGGRHGHFAEAPTSHRQTWGHLSSSASHFPPVALFHCRCSSCRLARCLPELQPGLSALWLCSEADVQPTKAAQKLQTSTLTGSGTACIVCTPSKKCDIFALLPQKAAFC
jgi:hypothetical protein